MKETPATEVNDSYKQMSLDNHPKNTNNKPVTPTMPIYINEKEKDRNKISVRCFHNNIRNTFII